MTNQKQQNGFKELETLFDNPNDVEAIETGDDEIPEFFAPVLHEQGTNLESQSQDEMDDFNYIRKSLISLIERGQISVEVAIRELKVSGHPRAAEVIGGLIKNVSETSEKLMDLHQKKQSDHDQSGIGQQHNTQNTGDTYNFIGTPAQILEMYEEQKKKAQTNNEGEILDSEVEEINDPTQ